MRIIRPGQKKLMLNFHTNILSCTFFFLHTFFKAFVLPFNVYVEAASLTGTNGGTDQEEVVLKTPFKGQFYGAEKRGKRLSQMSAIVNFVFTGKVTFCKTLTYALDYSVRLCKIFGTDY